MEQINKDRAEYFALVKERPDTFAYNEELKILLDEDIINGYESTTGQKIGIVYRSRFHIMIVDLVKDKNGNIFTYERLLPAVPKGAAVGIPILDGNFVLLKQFRHALREIQYSFPRGFAECGLEADLNIGKEIEEELGARVIESEFIGYIAPDSGILDEKVAVYACRISKVNYKEHYEGILDIKIVSKDSLLKMIADNTITDGFTLSACVLYFAKRRKI